MKNQSSIIIIAGLLSFSSAVAFADTLSSERALQKAIQAKAEQTQAANAKSYERIATLAGNKSGELASKKDAAANTYNEWNQQKSAVESSKSIDASKFKAVNAAAEKHAQANKAFVDMQKEILAQNGGSSDSMALAINELNAATPTAAGR